MEQYPLISILTTCRNARHTIRRCLDSVVSLDYPNIEFVIQDGASTDGTVELIQEYRAIYGDMIQLVSEPDSCATEGFFRVIKRCRGEIIGSCQADEELLPFAAMWAHYQFRDCPDADVVHGDIYNTDINGRIIWPNHSGPFDLVRYFAHQMTPHFAGTFFKRTSLERMGLYRKEWRLDIGEFDVWGTLGLNGFKIVYVPEIVTKYATHGAELTERIDIIKGMIVGRGDYLERLFARTDCPEWVARQKNRIFHGYHAWAAHNLDKHRDPEALYHAKMSLYYGQQPVAAS